MISTKKKKKERDRPYVRRCHFRSNVALDQTWEVWISACSSVTTAVVLAPNSRRRARAATQNIVIQHPNGRAWGPHLVRYMRWPAREGVASGYVTYEGHASRLTGRRFSTSDTQGGENVLISLCRYCQVPHLSGAFHWLGRTSSPPCVRHTPNHIPIPMSANPPDPSGTPVAWRIRTRFRFRSCCACASLAHLTTTTSATFCPR